MPSLFKDGSFIYPGVSQGTVKFNVKMSQWNWCEDNCKSANGVGDSVRLTIEMINQVSESSSSSTNTTTSITADTSNSSTNSTRRLSGCTSGSCENGAVEDLGGVFLDCQYKASFPYLGSSVPYTRFY